SRVIARPSSATRAAISFSATSAWPGLGAGISPGGDERRELALAGDDLVSRQLGRFARGEGADPHAVSHAPAGVDLGDVRVVARRGQPCSQVLGGLAGLVG